MLPETEVQKCITCPAPRLITPDLSTYRTGLKKADRHLVMTTKPTPINVGYKGAYTLATENYEQQGNETAWQQGNETAR